MSQTEPFWVGFRAARGGPRAGVQGANFCRAQRFLVEVWALMGLLSDAGPEPAAQDMYILYIYICQRPHLVGTFLGFEMSKCRGREEKQRQKKAERRKKKKLGNMENPHVFVGFFLANFNYKTGEKLRFLTKMCPPVGVSPIYIYIYTLILSKHTDNQAL